MNEVNSPTRRYRIEIGWSFEPETIHFCCEEEHPTIEEALKCAGEDGSLVAIDWAFGLRAEAPTFGAEWQETQGVLKEMGLRDA